MRFLPWPVSLGTRNIVMVSPALPPPSTTPPPNRPAAYCIPSEPNAGHMRTSHHLTKRAVKNKPGISAGTSKHTYRPKSGIQAVLRGANMSGRIRSGSRPDGGPGRVLGGRGGRCWVCVPVYYRTQQERGINLCLEQKMPTEKEREDPIAFTPSAQQFITAEEGSQNQNSKEGSELRSPHLPHSGTIRSSRLILMQGYKIRPNKASL